jgi:hypothetical protein
MTGLSPIRNGIVEAVLWVAIFARARVEPPPVSCEIVQRARSLGIKILIENYSFDVPAQGESPKSDDNDMHSAPEISTKTWYPAK